MTTKRENKKRTTKTEAIDQAAFEKAIRENLSPHGVAAIICYLRCAQLGDRPTNEQGVAALREVKWLADTLTEMLGDEQNQLIEELGL